MRQHFLLPLALITSLAATTARAEGPPTAPVRDTVETHWGVQVHDPYRYMENMKDAEVQAWFKGQADYTDSMLARIPGRDDLAARIKELDAGRPYRITEVKRAPGGRMYFQKMAADENVPKLYVRPSAQAAEQVLVDPAAIAAPDGGHYSLEFYVPSPDGKYMAYGLALSGSEQDVLHVLEIDTKRELPDVIDRIDAGYTDPQWLADGSGFYYVRRQKLEPGMPVTDGYKRTTCYLHRLGADLGQDRPAFALDLWPNVAMADVDFPSIVLTAGSNYAVGKIKHGDTNILTLYAAPLGAGGDLTKRDGQASPWKKVCDMPDSVAQFAVHGDQIYLMSALGAPAFKLVRTSLASPDFAHAATVIPAGEDVVDGVVAAHDAAYVNIRHAAAIQVERLDYAPGAKPQPLTLPEKYPSGRIATNDPDVDGVLVVTSAWTRAGRTYLYDPQHKTFTDPKLTATGKFDNVSGYESIEVEVPSHDGVKVPLSIVYKKGIKLDGTNPTLLYGYGSYGLSQSINYNPVSLAWLERGGVYAVAHVRGGGEKGEAWHLAGKMLNKPNTWKDFIACGEYLVHQGYTSPQKLAGQGGSAGGILVGRAVTERPDLFAAALFDVGALDALRQEFTMNGVPNIQEFGTVTEEAGFRGLHEMSTYAHVKDGVKYPAVMLSAGINDPRVDPWESGKTAARLQAATASGKPVLLRIDYKAGHGIGSTNKQRLSATADKYSFLLWQMGLLKPVP